MRATKILAAAVVLLSTAGLSTAVTQKPLPLGNGNSSTDNSAQSLARSPVRNLQTDALQMEALATKFVQQKRIPGMAMALVQNGRILSARGYGVTDVRSQQPIESDTVFRIASLSKAFAGTLTALLVQEQALRWDTPVSKQLPAFKLRNYPASQTLTVSDILSHQLGLPKGTFDRDLEGNVPYPLLAERLANAPLSCTPGECYAYQNIAYSLIGDMVFAVTGDFYTHQVETKLFSPLGMRHATYGREALRAGNNWAKPHVMDKSGWVSETPSENYYHVPPAAGVNASIEDMALWLNAQLGHRPDVLSEELLNSIHTPMVNTPGEMRNSGWRHARVRQAQYAHGWRVFDYQGHKMVFHGGLLRGYQGIIAFLPEQDTGIVVLWNSTSASPSAFLPTWMDRVLGYQDQDWLKLQSDATDVDPIIAE